MCHVKEETGELPNSNSFLLGSIKEETITYQNNNDNNPSFHNIE